MQYKKMMRYDLKKLSTAQKRVLDKMEKDNLILGCSEGENYTAWLESRDGKYIENINRATGNILYKSGALNSLDEYRTYGRNSYFELSERYKELTGNK